MDDVNIHIEEVVLDGASPLSPENVQMALSQEVPAIAGDALAHIAAAVAGQMRSRIGRQSG